MTKIRVINGKALAGTDRPAFMPCDFSFATFFSLCRALKPP